VSSKRETPSFTKCDPALPQQRELWDAIVPPGDSPGGWHSRWGQGWCCGHVQGEGGLLAIPGLEFSFAAVPAATTDWDKNLLEISV